MRIIEEYLKNDIEIADEISKKIIEITDEIAKKIIEEAENACCNCQEFDCWCCEYKYWRGMKVDETN